MKNKKAFFQTGKKDIYCFADNLELCRKLLDGGAKIIQLREKNIDDRGFYNLAERMLSLVRTYNEAILIINDRVEAALELKADGVHIGQEDENFHKVINRLPDDMIVGVSAHNTKEALDAEQAGATYLGVGAAFSTPTKPDASVIGIEDLRSIVKAVSVPVVAIGGISLENIQSVIKTGAQFYAIISQINNAKDISARMAEFFKLIREKES